MSPAVLIDGRETALLLIADHASNHVPDSIDLGIDPALLDTHIAIDIGVASLGTALCAELDCPGILGGISRLVIDYNREADAPGLIPIASDGHTIPGNQALDEVDRAERLDRWWRPYHSAIAQKIETVRPSLLISLHSFTPRLATSDETRPWEVGILYNRDERAARIAIPALEAAGIVTGDNLPYSGRMLNATMNTHSEGNGIAYLGFEVRQDLLADEADVRRWCDRLAPIIKETAEKLA